MANSLVEQRSQPQLAQISNRWMGVGYSAAPEAYEAAGEAARGAVSGGEPKLLMVFSSNRHDPSRVLEAINETSGGAPLIGCSTGGEMSAAGAGDGGIVVAALGGAGFRITTEVGRDFGRDPRVAGETAAKCSEALGEGHSALLLLADGRSGDLMEAIRGVNTIAGTSVPLIGGRAGDSATNRGTFQLHGEDVIREGMVAAAIESDGPIGIGWSHGWGSVGEPILITRSQGARVFEINDAPALDAYLDYLDAPDPVRGNPDEFASWAAVRPLGVGRRRRGQQPARCVNAADFSERSLICNGEVPQGGLAWFMHGNVDSVLASTREASAAALTDAGPGEKIGLVAFNCVGRRGILGDEGIEAEVELLNDEVGPPIAGLYTLGEIARRRGVNAVHSQTLAALAFG